MQKKQLLIHLTVTNTDGISIRAKEKRNLLNKTGPARPSLIRTLEFLEAVSQSVGVHTDALHIWTTATEVTPTISMMRRTNFGDIRCDISWLIIDIGIICVF